MREVNMNKSYERHADRRNMKLELGTVAAGTCLLLALGSISAAYEISNLPLREDQLRAETQVTPHDPAERGSVRFIETVPASTGQTRVALHTKELAKGLTKDVAPPAQSPRRISALIQAHIAAVNVTLLAPEISDLCE